MYYIGVRDGETEKDGQNKSQHLGFLPHNILGHSQVYVIFSWTQIGRSAIFGREIGVPDREIFTRKKLFNFSVKNCYLQRP